MLLGSPSHDLVKAATPIECLPARIETRAARGGTVVRVLLLVPATMVLVVPAALAMMLIWQAGPMEMATEAPITLVAALVQVALSMVLVWHGTASLMARAGRRRALITRDRVRLVETWMGRIAIRRVPLASYAGLAHNIRATLGGTHHEIVLVHRDPRLSLLLRTASSISEGELQRLAGLLRLPIVPARTLYPLTRKGWTAPALIEEPRTARA